FGQDRPEKDARQEWAAAGAPISECVRSPRPAPRVRSLGGFVSRAHPCAAAEPPWAGAVPTLSSSAEILRADSFRVRSSRDEPVGPRARPFASTRYRRDFPRDLPHGRLTPLASEAT